MLTDISSQDIQSLLHAAGLAAFTGQYTSLGGGEINNTFVLDCGETKVVLRIPKYDDTHNLANEARALGLLNLEQVPKLVYFDETKRIHGRAWIVESYIQGEQPKELSLQQFESLGSLLAHIHSLRSDDSVKLDFWKDLLDTNKHFGDEQAFLHHPDNTLKDLVRRSKDYFQSQKPYTFQPSLTHGDLSLSNMLAHDDTISLIDWEFSRFTDPMADFSTMFYEDMEYNKGKWRIRITEQGKAALFAGYASAGGVADTQRLQAWHNFDKLGGALYLYWKMHHSGHTTTAEQSAQYEEDLRNLSMSLAQNL